MVAEKKPVVREARMITQEDMAAFLKKWPAAVFEDGELSSFHVSLHSAEVELQFNDNLFQMQREVKEFVVNLSNKFELPIKETELMFKDIVDEDY